MELFERVRFLIEGADKGPGGKDSFARKIGINPHTLRGYLSKKREDNLWPLLEKILAVHPEVSRKWLYFGGAPFLLADDPDNKKLQDTLDELARTRQRALDLEAQVQALQGQVQALNKVITLQERTLDGIPFINTTHAPTSPPVAPSPQDGNRE